MDVDELNGSDDGDDDNDENLRPSITDPEIKTRNTLNITGGQISLDLESVTKSQPDISDLAYRQVRRRRLIVGLALFTIASPFPNPLSVYAAHCRRKFKPCNVSIARPDGRQR